MGMGTVNAIIAIIIMFISSIKKSISFELHQNNQLCQCNLLPFYDDDAKYSFEVCGGYKYHQYAIIKMALVNLSLPPPCVRKTRDSIDSLIGCSYDSKSRFSERLAFVILIIVILIKPFLIGKIRRNIYLLRIWWLNRELKRFRTFYLHR